MLLYFMDEKVVMQPTFFLTIFGHRYIAELPTGFPKPLEIALTMAIGRRLYARRLIRLFPSLRFHDHAS